MNTFIIKENNLKDKYLSGMAIHIHVHVHVLHVEIGKGRIYAGGMAGVLGSIQ